MVHTASTTLFDFNTVDKYSPVYNSTIKRLTQFFPGMGCKAFLKSGGAACKDFCSIPKSTRFAVMGPGHDNHFEPWHVSEKTYREMFDRSVESIEGVTSIALFNGGSFIINDEIPRAFREYAYKQVSTLPNVKQFMVESRPEYVTKDALEEAKDLLGDTDFMIGLGFESADDIVRNKYLSKFMSKKKFEHAVSLMQEMGVHVFVYVFLKAPRLTEQEAFEDVCKTCEYLMTLGVDEIALSCAFVPAGGQLEMQYNEGTFRPPYLWTIIEIYKEAQKHCWPLTIGGFDDFPPPVAIPSNCELCNDVVYSYLDEIRRTGTLERNNLKCVCKKTWQQMVTNPKPEGE